MNKNSISNYQDLIKVVAIILMLLDHFGYYFDNSLITIRIIGRPVMALFCFLAGYNYKLIPNFNILSLGFLMFILRYAIRPLAELDYILIPIFCGQCYISLFHNQLETFTSSYMHFVILGFISPFLQDYTLFSTYVVASMVLGYYAKYNNKDYKLCWLLCLLLSLLIAVCNFNYLSNAVINYDFTNIYAIQLIIVYLVIYYFITYQRLDTLLFVNINFISRNALYIYFFSVIIMEYRWFYFNN